MGILRSIWCCTHNQQHIRWAGLDRRHLAKPQGFGDDAMPDLELTFAAGSTNRLQPLLAGEVRPKGISLTSSVVRVSDIFWLMPASEPWDVCEMSLTGYLWAIQHGFRWTA